MAPLNLISLIKHRVLNKIASVCPNAWKTLIVDDHTKKLLDEVVSPNDILALNVTVIDNLQAPRPCEASLPAIYLLTPTTQNAQRVVADFAKNRRGYKEAHVIFIDVAPDELVQMLAAGVPPDVLKSVEEVYLNLWPVEAQVFSTQTPWSFYSLYGNPGSAINNEMSMDAFEDDLSIMSRTIINVLSLLEEDPQIRYAPSPAVGPLSVQGSMSNLTTAMASSSLRANASGNGERWKSALASRSSISRGGTGSGGLGDGGGGVAKKLAEMVEKELQGFKAENEGFPKKTEPPRPQGCLFIADRSIDPVAPFLHEFTYQAMVNDLLEVEDGKIHRYDFQTSIGHSETRDAVLSEQDTVWVDVRHLHMKDAIDKLMRDFNAFVREHGGFSAKQGAVSLNDMKDMLASLPQYTDLREKYSLHLSMAQTSMDLFEKKRLSDTGMVEQNCATGTTPEGKMPKSLVDDMVPLLGQHESVVSRLDKVRIIALYILFKDGVPDEDRRRLFQHAKLSLTEQDAINNLVNLGRRVVKNPNDRDSKKRLKQRPTNAEDEYELSRYQPAVKIMLEDHIANKLDAREFPYVKDAPVEVVARSTSVPSIAPSSGSLRSQRPNWHRAGASGASNTKDTVKQRLILFVAGGITYSEMRSAYQVGAALGREVIIGSTHIITPEAFIRDLKAVGRSGVGANPPNIHPLHPSFPLASVQPPHTLGQRYQLTLDRRHWTTFVPPPLPPPPPPVAAASVSGSRHSGGPGSLGSSRLSGSSGIPQGSYTEDSQSGANYNKDLGKKDKKDKKEKTKDEEKDKKKKKGFLRF
ncbi:Vesicle trafficking protein Sec1 [Phaffia rhodozyma]|uniref:Vesicle trafficking protein Sec1 n=1 Tax=Phaffia rhodozyma TaxID=264483 RepID=A0A0F7SGT3_PHARH|nr:Vesicle trafficking protein Sec1 [Phaffia rhodozyma]